MKVWVEHGMHLGVMDLLMHYLLQAGAKMTQMENRIVLCRFKDGYGPVGAYFLHLKTYTQNANGENYEKKWYEATKELSRRIYRPSSNTNLFKKSCIYSRNSRRWWTNPHGYKRSISRSSHLETVGWENFLGMTVGQAVVWASQNIDPKYTNPELTTSEPYVMGSHATCSGAWVSGPEDIAPDEYFWGYNRMMTIDGLFGAGDAPLVEVLTSFHLVHSQKEG